MIDYNRLKYQHLPPLLLFKAIVYPKKNNSVNIWIIYNIYIMLKRLLWVLLRLFFV